LGEIMAECTCSRGFAFQPPLMRLPALLAPMLDMLLPSSCVLCGALGREPVCPACSQAHAVDRQARCPCCANPAASAATIQDGARRCGACLADPPAFDATVAACDYAAPVDGLVLQLKFGSR